MTAPESEVQPICSRTGCSEPAHWNVNWRNPRIHTADRVKIWLACDEHRQFLFDYLATRSFPVIVTPLADHVDLVPDTIGEHPVTGWRILLSRRWLGYLAFAVAFAIACAFLSSWQLSRGKEAVAANAVIAANFDSTPIALSTALPSLGAFSADQQWQRVKATGHYLPKEELLVRNRPTNDGPGFEVLTPLQLADGSIFVVDRGWVPTGNRQDAPDAVPPPPSGEVTVIARLKPSEPRLDNRSASGNQVATIDLKGIAARVQGAVYTGAYGILDTQDPAGAAITPVESTPPVQDEGLHWSYMIQWVIFALIGFFGLGYAVRQEYRLRNVDDPAERQRAEERERRRASKKSDADIEDEILDAALR